MRSYFICLKLFAAFALSALCLTAHGELIEAADVMATCTSSSAEVDTREEHEAYTALGGDGVEVIGDVDYAGDMAWTADKTWIVTGVVLVKGGTLTIEPGAKVLLGVGSGIRQVGGAVVATGAAFEQMSEEQVLAFATAPGTKVDTREEHEAYAALGGDGVEVVGDVNYTGDVTWTTDKTWIVTGVVLVKGGTLTIEPGTKVLLGVGSGIRQVGGTVVAAGASFEQLSAEQVLAFATASGTEVDTREEHDAYAALGGDGVEVVGDIDYEDDVTWAAGKTWIVTGVVLVKGGTLTIEPGTRVLLGVGSGIRQVGGTVVADGVAFSQLSDEQITAVAIGNNVTIDTNTDKAHIVEPETVVELYGEEPWTAPKTNGYFRLFHADEFGDWDADYVVLDEDAAEVIPEGEITEDIEWSNGKTILVDGIVTVKNGATLIIAPGTVVKFMNNAGIVCTEGGRCVADGVIFTHVNDDTVGGDTLLDGTTSPIADKYELDGVVGNKDTEYRYCSKTPLIIFEDFERDEMCLALSTVGNFPNKPGIQEGLGTDESRGFGFGRSSCGSDAWDGYVNTLTASFGWKYHITKIEFDEMERYGNWGSQGFILVDGKQLDSPIFGKLPSNSGGADTTFRHTELSLDIAATNIGLKCWDITTTSELFIDNVKIYGTPVAIHDVTWVNEDGTVLEVDENEYVDEMPTYNGERLSKSSEGQYSFIFSGWSPKVSLVETNITYQAQFAMVDTQETDIRQAVVISENIDWAKEKVILIDGIVTVKSGATLTIEPGAVVKFMDGAGIVCEAGGRCVADGVIFTHVNDDTVGGDTLLDGSTSPLSDMYVLDGVSGNDATQYRYHPDPTVTLSGTIAKNEVWRGFNIYHVTGNITVPNGVTLTIEPGAIIKFDTGLSLTVNGGATLNAIGTRAQPIVFTSIKDDEYGGDTNGDGNKTMPYLGDWTKICVNGGTANFDYAHILYSSRNTTTGAINMPNGGRVVFNNGEIAHCAYDAVGVESGNFYMTNSVIRDCLQAFRHWARDPIVNCVIYDCGRLTQGGGQNFVNCIFSHITETWEAFGFPRNTTYRNCCFWNEGGSVLTGEGTQDAMTVCGKDGNIWGNPRFLDPGNGDFRVDEKSPCIDVADAGVAPEFDYFGQPRVNTPDIGICEVMPRNVTSDIDLVPQSVTADVEAVSGQMLTINWTVSNQGGADVDAEWRDTVSLVSENGRTITLGDKVITKRLVAGGTVSCSASFIVPAIAEGAWYPKVNVNSYRDVFEGAQGENNALTGGAAINVATKTLDLSVANNGIINANSPTVLKLAFDSTNDNRMVKFDVPAGVTVTWGFGFMPGGSRSVATASGSLTASGDGVMFRVPGDITDVYVILESDTTATYNLSTESTKMTITGVTPATLPSSGTTTLTITGAGFSATNVVSFVNGGAAISPDSIQYVNSQCLLVSLNGSKLNAGQSYDLEIDGTYGTVQLDNAISIVGEKGQGEFWAEMVLPEQVRAGRLTACKIKYGNKGNADIPVQVLQVTLGSENQGYLTYIDSTNRVKALQFVAAGDRENAGVIRAGAEHSIDFIYIPGGKSSNRRETVLLHSSWGQDYSPDGWNSADEYLASMSTATGRLALRGQDVSKYSKAIKLAQKISKGESCATIHGTLIGTDGLLLTNVLVSCTSIDESIVYSTSTDAKGRFDFSEMIAGGYLISFAISTNVRLPINVNGIDDVALGNIVVAHDEAVRIKVEHIENDFVAVFALKDDGTVTMSGQINENEFVFYNLEDGEYEIHTVSAKGSRVMPLRYCGGRECINVSMLNPLPVTLALTGMRDDCAYKVYVLESGCPIAEQIVENSFETTVMFELFAADDYKMIVVDNDMNMVTNVDIGEVTMPRSLDIVISASNKIRTSTASKKAVKLRGFFEPNAREVMDEANVLYTKTIPNLLASKTFYPPSGPYNCSCNQAKYDTAMAAFRNLLSWEGQLVQPIHALQYALRKQDAAIVDASVGGFASFFGLAGNVAEVLYKLGSRYFTGELTEDELNQMVADQLISMSVDKVIPGASIGVWFENTRQDAEKQRNNVEKAKNDMMSAIQLAMAAINEFNQKVPPNYMVCANFYPIMCYCGCMGPVPDPPYDPPRTNGTEIVTGDDPNEMIGPLGAGNPDTERFVKPGEWLTYTVYFENVSNATAAAQEVYVTNPLSEWLDWSTFEMGEIAFGNQIDLGLSGKSAGTSEATMKGTNFVVRTVLELCDGDGRRVEDNAPYQGGGTAKWYLRIVDPTTDTGWPTDIVAGFLPPNDETFRGEGHLTYRIKVRDDAPPNVVITNSASIVFDYNDPIETDPAWWNTVAPKVGNAKFNEAVVETEEGSNAVIRVMGGNVYSASSVKVYLTYNTAAVADVDLAKGTVDGTTPKGGLKFPLLLTWEKGEMGEKVITIPVKTDKTVEGDEFFTLQLAEAEGMELGEERVCTVTIRDTTVAAGKETLQDAVNNAVVKMSTSGKGKWAYAAVGTGGEAAPGKTASASAMSPILKADEMSELKAAAVKGSGTLTFDVRVANPNLEGESPEAAEGAAKTVLTLLDGKAELLAWTNETDWTSASYTVEETKATSHAFTWRVVQGADTNAHAYVANVVWSPAGTEMRALTLAAASYIGGEPCDDPFAGGTVSGGGVYPNKTKLSLVATAKVGWEFVGWARGGGARGATALPDDGDGRAGRGLPAADGEILSNKAKWQVVVTNDEDYVAVFEKIPYVRGLADPADGGKVSGSALCPAGKKVTLKATTNKNFTFLGWRQGTGNGELGTGNGFVATTASLVIDRTAKPAKDSKTSTTITNIAEDVTYYAVFKSYPEIFVTVDATDGTGAEPTGKGAGKYVAGTITGMGKYAIGKTKIALKAAANKGYVFAGWFDADSGLLTKNATYTVASMGENDVEYTARFVTADEDKASIALAVNGEEMRLAGDGSPHQKTNVWCGVYLEWPVAASALSETKVKVAGLPSGLKFTDKPVTSKIGSGKTAVMVTNVPANTIYGAPTAASKIDTKTGAAKPSVVKLTVTTAGKSTQTYQIDTVVDALPTWAQGTFAGGMTDGGQVSLTVSAAGKTSGKALGDGLTYTLAAPYYAGFEMTDGVSNFLADVTATWSYKEGTKTVKTNDVVQLIVKDNGIGGYAVAEDWFEAYTVNWKVEPWKTLGKSFDKKTLAYAILPDGSFSEDEDVLTSALGEEVVGRVTLKFAASGAVAIAGEFVTGYDGKKQKYTTVKATGSATLVLVDDEHGEVFIYLTPKGLAPHARCLNVPWPEE